MAPSPTKRRLKQPSRFQFNISGLFGLTAVAAVICFAIRTPGVFSLMKWFMVFGFLASTVSVIAFSMWQLAQEARKEH
jgi:hypothetical protein